MTACIVGWSHMPFGKHEAEDVESMIVKVAAEAVADAGFEPKDVDAVYLGHFGGGFSKQGFTASLVFQASDDFRFKPATRSRTRAPPAPPPSTRVWTSSRRGAARSSSASVWRR